VTITYTDSLPHVLARPPGWQADYEGGIIEFYCLDDGGVEYWALDDAEGGVHYTELACCGRITFEGTLHGDLYIDLPPCD
jgi:hypothetical protein